MTKKLDEATVLNELREGSAFFRDAKKASKRRINAEVPPAANPSQSVKLSNKPRRQKRTSERSNERTNETTNVRTNDGFQKREKIRHTFDIYADQLRALQTLQLEAVQAGKRKPKLGDMVQQALDTFIKKRRERKRRFDRSNEPTNEQI